MTLLKCFGLCEVWVSWSSNIFGGLLGTMFISPLTQHGEMKNRSMYYHQDWLWSCTEIISICLFCAELWSIMLSLVKCYSACTDIIQVCYMGCVPCRDVHPLWSHWRTDQQWRRHGWYGHWWMSWWTDSLPAGWFPLPGWRPPSLQSSSGKYSHLFTHKQN